jgi:hypothetical protein
VLRPGGYAAWVCKDFVRKGQRVPFSDQWQQLCEAVGFEPVERIAAMLVDDHGDQLDIFGGATARLKERKSFFRRLAEKKGSPRIDHEDVIIMRKPNGANGNDHDERRLTSPTLTPPSTLRRGSGYRRPRPSTPMRSLAEVKRGHEPGDIRRRFYAPDTAARAGVEVRTGRPALAAATMEAGT